MSRMNTSALCAAAVALLGVPAFAQTVPAPGTTPPAAETPAPAPMTPPGTTPPAAGATDTAPAPGATDTAPATPAPMTPATPAPVTPMAPGADGAVAAIDCEAEFTRLDVNADGFITDEESPRDFARSRIDEMTPGEQGMTRDEYLALCGDEQWATMTPEEGAPFEGANSFTEEQARDRAMAWNVTDVSALEKDDQGIWRGTGMVNGEAVNVAIDYKGNVVSTPQ